jgi:hypothetical protein
MVKFCKFTEIYARDLLEMIKIGSSAAAVGQLQKS